MRIKVLQKKVKLHEQLQMSRYDFNACIFSKNVSFLSNLWLFHLVFTWSMRVTNIEEAFLGAFLLGVLVIQAVPQHVWMRHWEFAPISIWCRNFRNGVLLLLYVLIKKMFDIIWQKHLSFCQKCNKHPRRLFEPLQQIFFFFFLKINPFWNQLNFFRKI